MPANNIYIQVDFNSQAAQQNVNALNQAIAQTGPAAEKSSKQASSALNSVHVSVKQTFSAMGDLTTAIAGLGIAHLIGGLVKLSAELGRDRLMMETFASSAAEATMIFDQMQTIARQGVFRVKDLEDTARTMMAFGLAAKDVPAMLLTITDQVTAMGGSIEQVNSIVRIFGRVMAKDMVGAMDLMRLLPQQGVHVTDALKKAMGGVTTDQLQRAIKEGALKPMETLLVMLRAMQQQTGGTGAKVNDAAKSFKNLLDMAVDAAEAIGGPKGFGPALIHLAEEIQQLLSPLAALFAWLMKLDPQTKQLIVNVMAATAAVVAFSGAWSIFTKIAGPAAQAIYGIGAALAKGLVAIITNPQLLIAMTAVTAFVAGFIYLYPEQAKKLQASATKFVTDLWSQMKEKVTELAKGSGLFDALAPIGKLPEVKGSITQEVNFDELQKEVAQWSADASKTILQALSSPAEAAAVKYKDLFDKLEKQIKDQYITEEHATELRDSLRAAQERETQARLFEKAKQQVAELAKIDAERVKGSYEAQIAYVEAFEQQDLRKKVAAIDQVTDLRVASAQAVANVEREEAEKIFKMQKVVLEVYRKEFEAMGVDVDAAIAARQEEMVRRQKLIDQKAIDDAQKYRLEGWKKANDAIIQDQMRVYDAFKSQFEQLFDALTDRTKSLGQALGDMLKKFALGEVRNVFSAQAAAVATEAAGYGRPTEQITRGGGILSSIFGHGLPPRPPGPPPDIYHPDRTESTLGPVQDTANRFEMGVDAYAQATIRFALAVQQFSGSGGGQGSADREVSDAEYNARVGGAGGVDEALSRASLSTGVSQPLLRAVAQVESAFRPGAISPKGALGLMQLMPATMKDWGVSDPFNAQQSALAGAQQLKRLLNRYGGDLPSALAAYNMGPAAYDRAIRRGRALPRETQAYVARVQQLMGQQAEAPQVYDVGAKFDATGYAPPFGLDDFRNLPMARTYGSVYGGLGGIATPTEITRAQEASVVAQAAGAASGNGAGAATNLANAAAHFKEMFGIGGGPHGQTTASTVLNSKGVQGLAMMAGSVLLSSGLSKRSSPLTIAGGTLMGVGVASQLGFTSLGGALFGAGAGIFAAGLQRGGVSGLAMTVGGGALSGAMLGLRFGGPLGAAIGAGIGATVGLATGLIRLSSQTKQDRIQQQIQQVYGVRIADRNLLKQIQEIVDQRYGGSIAVGVRSQDVQEIVRLYALSTGQVAGLPRPMYGATLAQSGQGLQLQPVYEGGRLVQNPYVGPTTYQYQSAIPNGVSLQVASQAGLIQGLTLDTIRGNPSAIAMASRAAASAGDSRLTTTQAMQEPLTALG